MRTMSSDDSESIECVKLTFSGDASRSLLIVDDDAPFRIRLARAMERRGFDVVAVDSVALGIEVAQESAPAYAVVDLRLVDGSGLDVVAALRDARPESRGGRPAIAVTARQPHVGRSGPLGTYSAGVRTVRPQCFGNGAPPENASANPSAYP